MGDQEPQLSQVPYDLLALVYDAIPPGQAYQSVLQQALTVLEAERGVSTILDLACGTGSASLDLTARGYQVVGLDRSPGMIAAARRKAARAGEAIDFRVDDMRSFGLERTVDAAVCLGDAVNHLLEIADLRACFARVAQAVRIGGLFVFDVNTLAGLKEWDAEVYVLHNADFAYLCECFLCSDVMTVNATFFLPSPAPPHFYRHQETFWERAWPLASLQEELRSTGWQPLDCWGWQTHHPGTEGDRHVTLIARRQG